MKRNLTLDILKILLAVMVLAIHSEFLRDVSPVTHYLLGNGIFRISVPIFLVINGFYFYTALSKKKTNLWLKNILRLYTVWMLVYAYFWIYTPNVSLLYIAKTLQVIFFGYDHLWYLPGMIGAALITKAVRNRDEKSILFYAFIMYLVGVFIQYLGIYYSFDIDFLNKIFDSYWLNRNFLFFGFPFFYLGYLINKYNFSKKISMSISIPILFCGLAMLISEVIFNCSNLYDSGFEGGFDNYFSILIVCPMLFIICSNIFVPSNSKNISLYATGIYFVHPFFLKILRYSQNLDTVSLTFITLLLSVMTVYTLMRINRVKKYVL